MVRSSLDYQYPRFALISYIALIQRDVGSGRGELEELEIAKLIAQHLLDHHGDEVIWKELKAEILKLYPRYFSDCERFLTKTWNSILDLMLAPERIARP